MIKFKISKLSFIIKVPARARRLKNILNAGLREKSQGMSS
jgi:hypothetical protein